MLSSHEPQLGSPSIGKFTKLANFSQIIPHFAKAAEFVRMLTHLRHALRFGHKPTAMCRAGAIGWLLLMPRLRRAAEISARYIQLLNGVGTPAGACRPVLALFELDGQHIEQALD